MHTKQATPDGDVCTRRRPPPSGTVNWLPPAGRGKSASSMPKCRCNLGSCVRSKEETGENGPPAAPGVVAASGDANEGGLVSEEEFLRVRK